MRAASCAYRHARLLCRRGDVSNHRCLVDRSDVALHVQQIPTVPRRQCRHARNDGTADDLFPGKFAIKTISAKATGVTPRSCLLSSLSRSSSEPNLHRTTLGTTRHESLRSSSLVILASRFLSRLFSLVERNRRRVNPSLETNTSRFDDVSVIFLL